MGLVLIVLSAEVVVLPIGFWVRQVLSGETRNKVPCIHLYGPSIQLAPTHQRLELHQRPLNSVASTVPV